MNSWGRADDLSNLLENSEDQVSSTNDKTISVEYAKHNDPKIVKRLNNIFSEINALNKVKITVANGIITLSGEVENKDSAEKAVKFANQIEGIIEVNNEISVHNSLKNRLQKTFNTIINYGEQVIAGLPIFVLASIVLSLFWYLGKWLSNKQALFRKLTSNYFIADLVALFVHVSLVIVGLVLALSLMDATALLGTILGAAGIFGLAIGFAVRDTVENFIASILLSLRNPFKVNDFVDIDGIEGNVLRLTTRATLLISPDGNHIRIPNAKVFKAIITNYSRRPERRFSFEIGIANEENLSDAQTVILESLQSLKGVLTTPKPQVILERLGDSNVILTIYAWVNQIEHDFLKTKSATIKSVKEAIDNANIAMPNPIYEIVISKHQKKTLESKHSNINNRKDLVEEVNDTSPNKVTSLNIENNSEENLLGADAANEI
jgi:small-conductance mechanosensitive channel